MGVQFLNKWVPGKGGAWRGHEGMRERMKSVASNRWDLLKSLASQASALDPARNCNEEAATKWGHVTVFRPAAKLLQTHSNVHEHFAHGDHEGESMEELTEKLINGTVSSLSLKPLVVAKLAEQEWVVFGNRRLKAVQDASRRGLQSRFWCVRTALSNITQTLAKIHPHKKNNKSNTEQKQLPHNFRSAA